MTQTNYNQMQINEAVNRLKGAKSITEEINRLVDLPYDTVNDIDTVEFIVVFDMLQKLG